MGRLDIVHIAVNAGAMEVEKTGLVQFILQSLLQIRRIAVFAILKNHWMLFTQMVVLLMELKNIVVDASSAYCFYLSQHIKKFILVRQLKDQVVQKILFLEYLTMPQNASNI